MGLKPGSNIGQTISDKIRKVKKLSEKKNKAIVLIIKQKETKCNKKKRNLKGLIIRWSLVRAQVGPQVKSRVSRCISWNLFF